MADDTSTTTDATERAADDTTTTEQAGAKPELPPEVKRALTKANKEAEQLRLKLKEFEDRDKTEQQKLTEAHQAAEQRAAAAELRALRLEVAADKGLTAGQAKRLVGTTREELEADAEDIQREFPATARSATLRPDPSQGSRGPAPVSGRDAGLAEAQKRFGPKPAVT
jgi:hypothetical protein